MLDSDRSTKVNKYKILSVGHYDGIATDNFDARTFSVMNQRKEKQGFIGNLENKTVLELKDMLHRQNNILKKRKFLKTLPDCGRKVYEFAEKLRDILVARGVAATVEVLQQDEDMFENIKKVDAHNDSSRTDCTSIDQDEQNCGSSEVKYGHHKTSVDAETSPTNKSGEDIPGTVRPSTGPDSGSTRTVEMELAQQLDRLGIKACREKGGRSWGEGDGGGEGDVDASLEWKCSAAYEKLIQKSQYMQDKTSFLPFCSLKIHRVEDLPEEFKFRSRTSRWITFLLQTNPYPQKWKLLQCS
ncbi:hypothetical protein ScPMuIL_018518 [Solemya velum]